MSTTRETIHAPTPLPSSEPRLDDRAFTAVLAAMLLMLLASLGGLADRADASSAPATAGTPAHSNPPSLASS